jgi:hypothetical protein
MNLPAALSLALAAIAVASCSASAPSDRAYYDGCQSGYVDGGDDYGNTYLKDESLFQNDADYRSGWQAGYDACYSRGKATPRMINERRR